jgi:hypothetical protein
MRPKSHGFAEIEDKTGFVLVQSQAHIEDTGAGQSRGAMTDKDHARPDEHANGTQQSVVSAGAMKHRN